ncbi:uncharacterized protein BYT42DRAFT_488596 [Radiomyces spectabilis]|uniref:uncharacterized protein n=1 Tax=Radiomyces spectabilis TaxID=64574 RepID=UPI00221EF819|nr:uncharacterized protein BYT42DRAFT_488596 [Radiomyces spectabilis]KAI8393936.1 hypothetical protein BYT42DRAFT_488596 [Radiomyces spectabilis]
MTQERLEWRQMLQSVLNGDVIESEKKRFCTTDLLTQQKPMQEIWLSLRALLRGRTIPEEQKSLEEGRKEIDTVLDLVLNFKIDPHAEESALVQVADVLKSIDRIESLYPTRANTINENPKYGATEFQMRLDALNAWCTITRSLHMQHKILRDWTGSEDLQIAQKQALPPAPKDADQSVPSSASIKMQNNDISFVERILKESALQDTFNNRTLSALNSLLLKSKQTMIENNTLFQDMNLPPFISELRQLANFPTSLVEEALKLRLEYRDRMNNPPKQMVDAMLEDYRGLLALACRVKSQYKQLAHPAPGWEFKEDYFISQNYGSVLTESVRFYFKLITWKLNLEKENSLRECELMEKEWEFLETTVCKAVENIYIECARQFCALIHRQLSDVMTDYMASLKSSLESRDNDMELEYTKALYSMRMRARKLLQFTKYFMAQFENSAEYQVDGNHMDRLVSCLVESDHFLVYTSGFEEEHSYVIASPSLYGHDDKIASLLSASLPENKPTTPSYLGTHPTTANKIEDYLLIISPWQNLVWTGPYVRVPVPYVDLGLKTNRVRLVAATAKRLPTARMNFWAVAQHSGIEVLQEQRAQLPPINKGLRKIRKTVFKLADSSISSIETIRKQTLNLGCQELVEECFSFASDFGVRTARFLDIKARRQLDLMLVRLAIDWISFITDDCIPTDRKTFRWAVAALEFGHAMTRGPNILALQEDEFGKLQSKVARCIALLISHFDVLGTRWIHEAQMKEQQQRKRGITAKRNSYMTGKRSTTKEHIATSSTFGASSDNAVPAGTGITYIRDAWMRKITELEEARDTNEQSLKLIGRVLDDQKPEDQSLVFLAPSSSNISFRWQQGKFIGAGTFGSVYLAINLDTSNVMAVKEIRFPDSSTLSSLHKAIKEEMKVMEMLNHRNIVQYYGMEVHRDKVYIFMEYCENGSLGALLEHGGRIEDEMYIVDYAYQLLDGLAYLHDNNIVHRDIKPDNILIDYQGQLKYTDFGASKILAKGQKTMGKTTMNMNLNSLAGTPMYMAPEVITGGDTGRKGSMDIWSLGCCIVQMATGRRPWSMLENEWSVMYHVVTGHPPLPDTSQLSTLGIDFLEKCFTRNPMKRPTAQELLSHPWITNYLASFMDGNQAIEGDDIDITVDQAAAPHWSMDEATTAFRHEPIRSYERSIVRSIPNSIALEGGINGSLVPRADTQAYFRQIAQQAHEHSSEIPSSLHSGIGLPLTRSTDSAGRPALSRGNSFRSDQSLVRSINEELDRPTSPV